MLSTILFLSRYASSLSHNHHHYEQQHTTTRRCLLQSALVASIPTAAACATTDADEYCQEEGLVPEMAIPGAYQNVCMTLPERVISVRGGNSIKIKQGTSVGAGRTGVAVWNSCLLLTRLLVQNQNQYIENKIVLELGCGTGLASIACARLGATRVISTDGNPEVVDLARQNVERNSVSNVVETTTLGWGLLNAMDYSDVADVIIGSDLTYNSGTWRVLTETISTILKPGGRFLYLTLGHSGFNVKGELDGFLQVIQSEGLVLDQSSSTKLEQQLPSMLSANEQRVLDATGGVRVVVLRKL